MLPDFVIDEITRRLRSEKLSQSSAEAVCRALGIDLDLALSRRPGHDENVEPLPYTKTIDKGVLCFTFTIAGEEDSREVHGRVVYAASPPDDESLLIAKYAVLNWGEPFPAPSWEPFPESLLPAELVTNLHVQIAERVARAAVRLSIGKPDT